jgi:phosphoserine phosphatase
MRPVSSKPVLLFDLDDTTLCCNSFPLWVTFLLTGRISGIGLLSRLRLSAYAMRLLLSRKLHRINHDEFQRCLQVAWVRAGGRHTMTDRFVTTLLGRIRPNIGPLLDLLAEHRLDAVLATAAAADYAVPLAHRLGFRHVLATQPGRLHGESANAGPAKRASVASFLASAGWCHRPLILFTDHQDDLPLIRDCAVVCWFGSFNTLAKVRTAVEQTKFVYCRDMTAEGLRAEVLSLYGWSSSARIAEAAESLSAITSS